MERLIVTVEKLLSLSALAAALGYMSLRAHFNYLGIVSVWPLSAERYLGEVYVFGLGTLLWLLALGLATGLLALSGKALDWVWLRSKVAAQQPPTARLVEWLRRPAVGFLWLLVAVVAALQLLSLAGQQVDVVVGDLSVNRLAHRHDWVFGAGLALLVGTAAIWRLQEATSTVSTFPSRGYWFRAVLVALVLLLPLMFGRAAHPVTFPVCHLRVAKADVCGLLVVSTESRLSLWRASAGKGEVLVTLASQVSDLRCGELRDILDEAEGAAFQKTRDFPVCSAPPGIEPASAPAPRSGSESHPE